MVKNLGQGAYGKVVCVRSAKSEVKYAMKIISKKLIENLRMIDQLKNEVSIMKRTKHENIIEFLTHFEDSKNIYFILDLAEEGHLYSRLKKKGKYKEDTAARVTRS
jgi:serine/threonine protein kinase